MVVTILTTQDSIALIELWKKYLVHLWLIGEKDLCREVTKKINEALNEK